MLYLSIPVSGIPIVPEHIWKSHVAGLKNYRNMDFPVVGYGPFVLTGFKTNQYAAMTANKSFFLGAPGYDKVVTNYYSNSDAAAAALTSGRWTRSAVSRRRSTRRCRVKSERDDLPDPVERLDGGRDQLGRDDPHGQADGHRQPDPEGHPGPPGDRARASTGRSWSGRCSTGNGVDGGGLPAARLPAVLLEAVGLRGARTTTRPGPSSCWTRRGTRWVPTAFGSTPQGKPLEFRLGIHSDDATDASIAPYLKEWMAAIGIKLDVNAMSFDQLNNNLAKGDWDMLMDGWSTGPDPTYLLSIQTCGTLPEDNGQNGNTDAFFCNHNYDHLYDKQQTQFDATQRAATIAAMQKILYANNADLILFYKNGLSALRTDQVTGLPAGREGRRRASTRCSTASPAGGRPSPRPAPRPRRSRPSSRAPTPSSGSASGCWSSS